MNNLRIAVAMCGSFCTFSQVMPMLRQLKQQGAQLIPIMSSNAAGMDTKFGTAKEWKRLFSEIAGDEPLTTIQQAEPLGPKDAADVLLIAPCTGNTMAKLAAGITDGVVTMAAKSMLRGGKPVVIALSTNDGLSGSAKNIGELMNRKNYYFVPFGQDDFQMKPCSLQADFEKIPAALQAALNGKQLQPVLINKVMAE